MIAITDEQIVATIRADSRACYGHEGGGVTIRDITSSLFHAANADELAPWSPQELRAAVTRQLVAMARRGVLRPGKSLDGCRFYRVIAAV